MSDPTGQVNEHPLDDLAAHALDALDPAERHTVDDHLAHCAACRAELANHHETLAALAPTEAPPPQVWDGIAAAIATVDRVDPVAATVDAPDRSALPEAANGDHDAAAVGGADPDEPASRASVSSLDEVRARRVPSRMQWLAAAACILVAAALGGVVGFALGDSDGGGDIGSLAQKASQDPGSVLATLADSTGEPVARVVEDEDGAYVLLEQLNDLPEGRAYQLWSIDGSQAVSLGMLGRDGTNTVAFRLPPTITELAISVAPTSGDVAPIGDFQATGDITRSS